MAIFFVVLIIVDFRFVITYLGAPRMHKIASFFYINFPRTPTSTSMNRYGATYAPDMLFALLLHHVNVIS